MQIQRYVSKISGPLLDRIDIHIDVPAVKFKELASDTPAESSAEIRDRVVRARRVQLPVSPPSESFATLRCRRD
jgi:magnesium chelatase family protein